MALDNGLLIADVAHTRLLPKKHALKYKVYYLCFPLSKMQQIASKLLSLKGWNLFGFREGDHGFGEQSCETWVRSLLAEWKLPEADGDVVLLTMPRVLGYGFNPVSFWFCLDKSGALRAVVSEVNNTFNERHCYLCFHEDHRPITSNDWLESEKVFHVSPFLKVRGKYAFRFAYSEQKIGVWIDYYDNGEKVLITSLVGKRSELSDRSLMHAFFRYPLVTLKVIGLIHYHALRLVMKGIKYNRKPTPPTKDITS
jgi:DUF1365 family protein